MYKIIVDYSPSQADNAVVTEGLLTFNKTITGKGEKLIEKPFSVFLKNNSGEIFGGIQACFDTESIYINILWVEENFRKQGYGKKLLDTAEQEAIKNGCIFSKVDTWDFQAEGFYLKNGYERMGEVKNYWLSYSKIFFRKSLTTTDAGS